MCNKVVLSLFTSCLILFFVLSIGIVSVEAYLSGYAFGANPPLLDLDLDLDSLTRAAALYPQIGILGGLYGLYGLGGLYGLYGLGGLYGLYGIGGSGLLNYLGYLYGVYGTDIENAYTNPAGINPSIWSQYGITYNPVLGYYQPLDLFGSMFTLTNLLSWW